MSLKDRLLLGLQYLLGQTAVIVVAPIVFLAVKVMGYRIRDLGAVRRRAAALFREHEGPWLICPNHLTMIDSVLVSYGMASLGSHIFRFRRVPWNLPERDNFQKNPFLAAFCYLAKCLPVNRGGSRQDLQRLLDKCRRVLKWRQNLLVFPEGGRSRSGRVEPEKASYGVGRFVEENVDLRVILVYLRGDGQETFGMLPRKGEVFTMHLELFNPGRLEGTGLRVQREYALRIARRLAELEAEYFAARG